MSSKRILLVADAGGSKTEWWISQKTEDSHKIVSVPAINASVSSDEAICLSLLKLRDEIEHVEGSAIECYFFGAGCNSDANRNRISELFKQVFFDCNTHIEVKSDIEGAARALFGNSKGIVCILGTGSASGLYDGKNIIDSVPSLGYILGDEGGGASMGKKFINQYFKREFSPDLHRKISEQLNLSITDVIKKVYRSENANRYLASFVPFIKENEDNEELCILIDESLKLFFEKNVLKYNNTSEYTEIGFVGGVASVFESKLLKLARQYGFEKCKMIQKPIDSLGKYYSKCADR